MIVAGDRRRRRAGAQLHAPVPGALHRRHGLARARTSTTSSSRATATATRRARSRTCTSREAGGGDGCDPRRADRQGRALRPEGSRSASGSPPTATPASARCSSRRWPRPRRTGCGCCATSRSSLLTQPALKAPDRGLRRPRSRVPGDRARPRPARRAATTSRSRPGSVARARRARGHARSRRRPSTRSSRPASAR